MILKGFKEKSNINYINAQLKKRVVTQANTKVRTIGIIFNSEKNANVASFETIVNSLGITKNSIKIVAFKPELKEEEYYNPTYTLKHIGWRGKIKDKNLEKFLNTEFDLLINYYKADVVALKVMSVSSKAKFKVGILESDERINDLIIKTEINDFNTFVLELNKYLSILNKI